MAYSVATALVFLACGSVAFFLYAVGLLGQLVFGV
jgi:hypothetical protein